MLLQIANTDGGEAIQYLSKETNVKATVSNRRRDRPKLCVNLPQGVE